MLEILSFIWQFLQSIGWNGISEIATLISAIAALIVAIDTRQKRREPPQLLPPKYILTKPTRKLRRRRRHKHEKGSNSI